MEHGHVRRPCGFDLSSFHFGVAAADFVAVSDGAGEIAALGPDVTGWAVGDKVIGAYYSSSRDGPPAPKGGA